MQPWALEVIEQIEALQDSVQAELDKVTAAETVAIERLSQPLGVALEQEPHEESLLGLSGLSGRSLSELEDIRRVFTDTLKTLQAAKEARRCAHTLPRVLPFVRLRRFSEPSAERCSAASHAVGVAALTPATHAPSVCPQYLIRGKFESQDSGLRAVDEIFENLSQRVRRRLRTRIAAQPSSRVRLVQVCVLLACASGH